MNLGCRFPFIHTAAVCIQQTHKEFCSPCYCLTTEARWFVYNAEGVCWRFRGGLAQNCVMRSGVSLTLAKCVWVWKGCIFGLNRPIGIPENSNSWPGWDIKIDHRYVFSIYS